MGIILDIIIVLILFLNIYFGYKKGLIKVAFNAFAFLIAIIATLILFNPIATLVIKNTEIDENIKSIIVSNFNKTPKDEKNMQHNDKIEINVDNSSKEKDTNIISIYINDKIKDLTNEAKEKTIETIATNISEKIVKVIIAIALFIAIRVLIILLKFLSESISDLPIIKQFNKAGGVLYGLLKSVLIIYLLLTVLFIINSMKNSEKIQNLVYSSYITKVLYENNAIVDYCLLDKNLL